MNKSYICSIKFNKTNEIIQTMTDFTSVEIDKLRNELNDRI